MRYHFKAKKTYNCNHGIIYNSHHPIYNRCTLYFKDGKGLCVVQQRFKPFNKSTWWSEVSFELADAIFEHPGFSHYFKTHAREEDENGLYPTVTVRQIMWALRMKPLKKERWETVFDRKEI